MKTWTADGIQDIIPNGIAQKGEGLWNPSTNSVKFIDKGKEGVDDQPVNVQDETFIPSNAFGFDKILEPHMKKISNIQDKQRKIEKNANLSSLSQKTKEIQDREVGKYIDQTIKPVAELQKSINESNQYNCGKSSLRKFDMGFIGRSLPTIAGLTAGLGQLAHWSKNPPATSNVYAANPYETRALSDLAKLRYNPYPDIQASQDAERRAAYANEQAGGMLGSQRYTGRIGLGIAGMRNAANIYANAQVQNNKLAEARAKTMLEVGNQAATRRQNANQFDYNTFTASHGAKTKGIERSVANILNAINAGYSNEFKYKTWQDTANIYRQQVDNEQKALLANMRSSQPMYAYEPVVSTPRYYGNYRYFNPSEQYQLKYPDWKWKFGGLS